MQFYIYNIFYFKRCQVYEKNNQSYFLAYYHNYNFIIIFFPEEQKNLEILKSKKYTICFVDGAHENFDVLNAYTPYRWKGGNAHQHPS